MFCLPCIVAILSCFVTQTRVDQLAAVQRGREFLVSLCDETIDLLPEYRGARVYWLYHDNYLAEKVLEQSHPDVARKIAAAIHRLGERRSGKIEILFDEADAPLPFRQFQLVEVQRMRPKIIRTERLTDQEMPDWESYADLCFFAAIAIADKRPMEAERYFLRGINMWDGLGLKDRVAQAHGTYATYKLALAILAAETLHQVQRLPDGLMHRLETMQEATGGWITDYTFAGQPVGKANVETTCLAILALERFLATAEESPADRP